MDTNISSREAMLSALNCKKPEYIPCSFMLFRALMAKSKDQYDFVKKQQDLGLDPILYLPLRKIYPHLETEEYIGPQLTFHPEVKIKEWIEDDPSENLPMIHKEFSTPEGKLKVEVRKTKDWPYGDHIPYIFDDFLTPVSRSRKYLVNSKDDLNKLKYLLTPPNSDAIKVFMEDAKEAKRFAENENILLGGMWGYGLDAAAWLCGLENILYLAIDDPGFVQEFIEFISSWNIKNMELSLDAGADIFVKRVFYESSTWWSPKLFKKFILPTLKKEVELCKQAGTKLILQMSEGSLPIIDLLLEAKVDALAGIDPVMDSTMDLKLLKEKVKGKMCLWGGVNEAITLEKGSREEIRDEVERAVNILGKDGGFIMTPVENVIDMSEDVWKKVIMFIEAWKDLR
ncbi:MAG: hypothetical protein KAQ81_04270 [Deltaproteobacteria bacterium]|nr:hypothetical protein [Deltaproteobacteria bacterium]